MGNIRRLSLLTVTVALAGCTVDVHPPDSAVGNVRTEHNQLHGNAVAEIQNANNIGADMAIEAEVSEKCVAAWRKALAGDQKGALADLEALSQRYPNVSTINFMRGQILDHGGDKAAAIEFYRKSLRDKEFSTIYVFKLAEALRATKKNEEAITEYRRLLASAPTFVAGKIGLAKALLALDKHSAEARKELESALDIDKDSAEAKKVLQSIEETKR